MEDKITNALETLEVADAIDQKFGLNERDENEKKLKYNLILSYFI
jgi:hypothetical protein